MIKLSDEYEDITKIVRGKCLHCENRTTTLVRISDDGIKTQVTYDVCTTPKCFMHTNISKVRTWEVRSA